MPEKTETDEAEEQYMTVPEAAARLGVTDRSILNWIKLGYFSGTKRISPTGPHRIPLSAIVAFEKNRKIN